MKFITQKGAESNLVNLERCFYITKGVEGCLYIIYFFSEDGKFTSWRYTFKGERDKAFEYLIGLVNWSEV